MTLLLPTVLLSCGDSAATTEQRCEVTLTELVPDSGLPGESVELTASPLTETWDTALYVGGVRAEVTALTREGCDDCDECVEDAACNICGDCDDCDLLCEQECLEIVSFLVPELAPGEHPVQLFNTHGGSTSLTFTVPGDGDTGDTGDTAQDTGDTAEDTGDTAQGTGDTAQDTGEDSAAPGDTAAEDIAAGDARGAALAAGPYPTCPVGLGGAIQPRRPRARGATQESPR